MTELETLKLRLKAIDTQAHPAAARKIEQQIAELEADSERWIDPAVLRAFKAALPATEADGGIDWPYRLWHASRGWVEFNSLAEMEAAAVEAVELEPLDLFAPASTNQEPATVRAADTGPPAVASGSDGSE